MLYIYIYTYIIQIHINIKAHQLIQTPGNEFGIIIKIKIENKVTL